MFKKNVQNKIQEVIDDMDNLNEALVLADKYYELKKQMLGKYNCNGHQHESLIEKMKIKLGELTLENQNDKEQP